MAESSPQHDDRASSTAQAGQYVVVARRYRPQTFADLVGQEHVARALSSAIASHRVGHAYLFTGARGVGKTSAARILAKALNCVEGPTPTPCNVCDICRSISSGEDVDVLEIDGASNRGIDEIRQLRQNVSVRPSRARLKIYIIDEVHMLTREAFNALLKTLEEPPEHVKFIFCTTEPTKIPVTILSRCQRFDFAGIQTAAIARRLREIADAEHVAADADALELLARRAAGSMRDGQSLLEQLLAFGSERITVADVHRMLGTAGEERLQRMVGLLLERDAGAALAALDAAIQEGVDPGLLLEQLFGYFRDCMAAVVGCPGEMFLYCSPSGRQAVTETGKRLGIQTILAMMQILEQTASRLRYSTQDRVLLELALVRICHLEDLDELPGLIAQLRSGAVAGGDREASAAAGPPSPPEAKKKDNSPLAEEPGGSNAVATGACVSMTPQNVADVWSRALSKVPGLAAEQARKFDRVAISGPNHLVISFKPAYTFARSLCAAPDQAARFEQAVAELTGQPVRIEFTLTEEEAGAGPPVTSAPTLSPHQRMLQVTRHPMVQRAVDLFGASPTGVQHPAEGS